MTSKYNRLLDTPLTKASIDDLLSGTTIAAKIHQRTISEVFIRLCAAASVLRRHGLVDEHILEAKKLRKKLKGLS